MDQRQCRRHRIDVGRQRQCEQVAADREQHVVLFEDFADRPLHPRHAAAKQRMRRRERGRARHELGVDRRADEFGELDQLGMRAAVRHGIAGDDQRPLRLREHRGGFRDRGRIAAQPRRDPRRRQQVDVALGLENVAGQRQEYRPGRRRQRGLGGAMHEPRQVGEPVHLGGPFDERPRHRRQVGPQDRLGGAEVLVVLAGGDEDRRAGLLRIVEHAHGVAEARA